MGILVLKIELARSNAFQPIVMLLLISFSLSGLVVVSWLRLVYSFTACEGTLPSLMLMLLSTRWLYITLGFFQVHFEANFYTCFIQFCGHVS